MWKECGERKQVEKERQEKRKGEEEAEKGDEKKKRAGRGREKKEVGEEGVIGEGEDLEYEGRQGKKGEKGEKNSKRWDEKKENRNRAVRKSSGKTTNEATPTTTGYPGTKKQSQNKVM